MIETVGTVALGAVCAIGLVGLVMSAAALVFNDYDETTSGKGEKGETHGN